MPAFALVAEVFGLRDKHVAFLSHCGSRGFGNLLAQVLIVIDGVQFPKDNKAAWDQATAARYERDGLAVLLESYERDVGLHPATNADVADDLRRHAERDRDRSIGCQPLQALQLPGQHGRGLPAPLRSLLQAALDGARQPAIDRVRDKLERQLRDHHGKKKATQTKGAVGYADTITAEPEED